MASTFASTNGSERDQPLEPVVGANLHVNRPAHQPSTVQQKWRGVCEHVSEGIRKAVYMNKIAPQEMRQHLMLNQARLKTVEEVAQEIEDYWDATEEFSSDEKGQAGFIVGFQPERGEQRRLEDTAIGVGDSASKKRSVGLIKSTQRAIHHKTRCKERFVNGRTQRNESCCDCNAKRLERELGAGTTSKFVNSRTAASISGVEGSAHRPGRDNFQVKGSGRTPHRSLRGKDYTGEVVPLGEVCLGRDHSEDGGPKLNVRLMRGVFVGKLDRTDEFSC